MGMEPVDGPLQQARLGVELALSQDGDGGAPELRSRDGEAVVTARVSTAGSAGTRGHPAPSRRWSK